MTGFYVILPCSFEVCDKGLCVLKQHDDAAVHWVVLIQLVKYVF